MDWHPENSGWRDCTGSGDTLRIQSPEMESCPIPTFWISVLEKGDAIPQLLHGSKALPHTKGHGVLFGKGAAQGMHGHCPLSLPMRGSTTSHGKQRAVMPS